MNALNQEVCRFTRTFRLGPFKITSKAWMEVMFFNSQDQLVRSSFFSLS